jgi:hypothetical protein
MSDTKDTKKEAGNETKSSLNSAVTTDLPSEPAPPSGAKLTEAEEKQIEAEAKSFEQRAIDASIGEVRVDGIDFRYIGVSPARELAEGKEPKTPGKFPITPENSRFIPLTNVGFNPSVRIKDAVSGEYYYPADGVTSYEHAELNGNYLVPQKPDPASVEARKQALRDAKAR